MPARVWLVWILWLGMPLLSLGQVGSIVGTVFLRAEEGRVPYASFLLEGTGIGTTADSAGRFRLGEVPEGRYILISSAIGYEKAKQSMKVEAGKETAVRLSLASQDRKLEEVVVTGVSRQTKAVRSPLPVSLLSKKEIDLSPNGNVIDAAVRGVAGLSAVTTGPNISKPFIRGLGYNRVLTLYDGIRQESQQWGDEHGIEADPYGMARIEVVKGPASLSYGSDALAGVVNLIPYLPAGKEGKLAGEAVSEYQTNNGLAALSGGAAYRGHGWTYAARATHKMAHDYRNPVDGYVYNTGYKETVLTGTVRQERVGGFSQLSANLYDNLQEIPDGSRDSATRRFTYQTLDAGDDIRRRPIVSDAELRSYGIAPLHQHIQHYRLYTHNRFKLGQGSINASLAAQQSVRREYNHPTLPEQAGLYVQLNTYTYNLLYEAPTWHGVELNGGLNGMYQRNRSRDATAFPIPDYSLFDIGGFATARATLGRWELSGGARMDARHLSWADFYVATDSAGFDRHLTVQAPDAHLQYSAFAKTFTGFSGSAGVTYTVREGLYLKANIGRGYRAPSITEMGSNGLDPGAHIVYLGDRSFNPEQSLQEDLGVAYARRDWDLGLNVFANHIGNFIYLARAVDAEGRPLVVVPGNTTYRYSQTRALLYGGEATANWHPAALPWLALNNSMALTEGRTQDPGLLERSGLGAQYLPFIPPLHGRTEVRATAQRRWGAISKPFVKAEARYYAAKNHFYGVDYTETATPGYALVGLGIGASLADKDGKEQFRIVAQADNLFDKAYQSNLSRLKYFEYYAASPNGKSGIYNMGRNFSVKATYIF